MPLFWEGDEIKGLASHVGFLTRVVEASTGFFSVPFQIKLLFKVTFH